MRREGYYTGGEGLPVGSEKKLEPQRARRKTIQMGEIEYSFQRVGEVALTLTGACDK